MLAIGRRKGEPKLEATPYGAIKQFSMVAGGDDDDVAGQLVELHQEKRNHSLDFAGLVRITALFADGIELVKKQHAGLCPDEIKKLAEPSVRFPQVASDQSIIANNQKRQRESLSDALCKRCFAISRRAREQHTMPGLKPMGP